MPGWNGSGTFERYYDWTDDEAAGQNIEAARFDQENDTFASGINNCLCKDGQNSPTTDLPMGTNKHTGVGNGSARDHYLALGQFQDAGVIYSASGGSANAQTIAPSPAITAYATGQRFFVKAGLTNTGACTLNVNGLGAKNIYMNGAALVGGEIQSGQMYMVVYDGTQFHLFSPAGGNLGGCKVYLTANESFTDNTAKKVPWDAEEYDDAAFWAVGNPTRFTIPAAGRYRVHVNLVSSDALLAADVVCSLYLNGSIMAGSIRRFLFNPLAGLSASSGFGLTFEAVFAASDYIEVEVKQKNAGAAAKEVLGNATATAASWASIERIR